MNTNTNFASSFVRRASALALAIVPVALVACSGEDADDTVVEPSLEQRVDGLAEAACARYADTSAGCPGYGTGSDQKYETEAACESDFENKANDMWPASKCADGRVDAVKYDSCLQRVKAFACSTGGQNILDGFSALADCSSDEVCTDAAR